MKLESLYLTRHSEIRIVSGSTGPIERAVTDLRADMERALPAHLSPDASHLSASAAIEIHNREGGLDDETYRIHRSPDAGTLCIEGGNELGTIFGIYRLSRDILGTDPFYRWTGVMPQPQASIVLPQEEMNSPQPRFRFRGWFINGEDSLIAASGGGPVNPEYFEWIFETLLRTGNNLVIPGTFPEHPAPQYSLAVERGLWLTHHHAEPLGAPLFSYIHPDIPPEFRKQKERFRQIYMDTAKWYAERNAKAVFTVGFRGQGDRPFWRDFQDIEFSNEEKRNIIVEAIKLQIEVLSEMLGKGTFRAVFPLYAEAHALFIDHLDIFPPEVILCWADNGYGAMRVRRAVTITDEAQSALPAKTIERPQGVYYHVNFHDLEASNQLTMLVDPRLVVGEYQRMIRQNVRAFSICNAGNVRPHMYALDLLSGYLGGSIDEGTPEEIVAAHGSVFFARWFGGEIADRVARLQQEYFSCPLTFGDFPDQKTGDEFYHYVARAAVCRTLKLPSWEIAGSYFVNRLGGLDGMLKGVAEWTDEAQPRWKALAVNALEVRADLPRGSSVFDATLVYQIWFCAYGNRMLSLVAQACLAWRSERYMDAFVLAQSAYERAQEAVDLLQRMDEHFVPGFYAGEFLTNAKATRHCLRLLLEMTRVQVDGPGLFRASSMVNVGNDKPNTSILPLRYYRDDNRELAAGLSKVLNIPQPDKELPNLPPDFLTQRKE